MASRKAKARANRKSGYVPSLLIGKPEYVGVMKACNGPPIRPYPIRLKELIELPPKKIIKKPELLPPYTEVAINQAEEVLDLDELRSYGRYVLLSYDGDRVKALISNNITEPTEIDNPQYHQTITINAVIEKANKQAQERFALETAEYEKALADYNAKNGIEAPKEIPPEHNKQVAVSASYISDWNAWNNYAGAALDKESDADESGPVDPQPAGYSRWEGGLNSGYSRWERAPKYSGLNIGEKVISSENARDIPLEVVDEEE